MRRRADIRQMLAQWPALGARASKRSFRRAWARWSPCGALRSPFARIKVRTVEIYSASQWRPLAWWEVSILALEMPAEPYTPDMGLSCADSSILKRWARVPHYNNNLQRIGFCLSPYRLVFSYCSVILSSCVPALRSSTATMFEQCLCEFAGFTVQCFKTLTELTPFSSWWP